MLRSRSTFTSRVLPALNRFGKKPIAPASSYARRAFASGAVGPQIAPNSPIGRAQKFLTENRRNFMVLYAAVACFSGYFYYRRQTRPVFEHPLTQLALDKLAASDYRDRFVTKDARDPFKFGYLASQLSTSNSADLTVPLWPDDAMLPWLSDTGRGVMNVRGARDTAGKWHIATLQVDIMGHGQRATWDPATQTWDLAAIPDAGSRNLSLSTIPTWGLAAIAGISITLVAFAITGAKKFALHKPLRRAVVAANKNQTLAKAMNLKAVRAAGMNVPVSKIGPTQASLIVQVSGQKSQPNVKPPSGLVRVQAIKQNGEWKATNATLHMDGKNKGVHLPDFTL